MEKCGTITTRKIKKKRKQPEAILQKSIIQYLKYAHPKLLYFAVPNGGKRNPIEASKLKAMGVLAGVADLLLFKSGCFYAIELKIGNNKPNDTQIDFEHRWLAEGGKYAVCRSLDELDTILKGWGI